MATAKYARSVPMESIPGICTRVGRKIRELRKMRGWSQQLLADHAQVERAHLARLEDGKREAGLLILERIATALEVDVIELLRHA